MMVVIFLSIDYFGWYKSFCVPMSPGPFLSHQTHTHISSHDMHLCVFVCLFTQNFLIEMWSCYIFLESAWLSESFEPNFGFLRQLMPRRVRTLPAWICFSAHARIFMKNMLTYYIFSESALDSASFEYNFSFLRQFSFFLLFLAPNLMTS